MNPTTSSPADEKQSPWVWPLLLVAVVAAVLLRLYPVAPNFALVGALALFAGARLRSWEAYLVPLGVMLVSDLFLWQMYGLQPFNLVSYVAFGLYVAIGQFLVARRGVFAIIAGTVTGGLVFFVLTNALEWWQFSVDPATLPEGASYLATMQGSEYPYPRLEYARNVQGLCACYWLALPFFRNTLAGDGLFVTALFGANALLARYAPAGLFARKEQS